MKHLSIDFWNTLGTPNAKYAEARNLVLAMAYGRSVDEAAAIYAEVKAAVDRTHSQYCRPLPLDVCYTLLHRMFVVDGGDQPINELRRRQKVQLALENAFRAHPPKLLPGLAETLQKIQAQGVTMSITSNTNFIRGALIREVVLEPVMRFDFYLFSDEVGYAKPHPKIWEAVIDRANVYPQDILHIGDDVNADYGGAVAAGLNAAFVMNPTSARVRLGWMLDDMEHARA